MDELDNIWIVIMFIAINMILHDIRHFINYLRNER